MKYEMQNNKTRKNSTKILFIYIVVAMVVLLPSSASSYYSFARSPIMPCILVSLRFVFILVSWLSAYMLLFEFLYYIIFYFICSSFATGPDSTYSSFVSAVSCSFALVKKTRNFIHHSSVFFLCMLRNNYVLIFHCLCVPVYTCYRLLFSGC